MSSSQQPWRTHPLDGAVLLFHPASGTNVRVDAPATRALRRRAPRTVMFGITNRCNLDCHFCSRDVERPSRWTADEAFEVLSRLAGHGVLEVAFGGGEPFAFRGFDALVERLHAETALAVHVTTNGSLLTPERIARLKPALGEVRVSLYDGQPWRGRIALLAAGGMRFGANVLATPASLPVLPGMLRELAALGCRDVAVLSYVGADRALHLSAEDDARLAEIIAESPLPARISVCFGARLHALPLLDTGRRGDCGAGRDFIVVTADKRVQACSFHPVGPEISTAEDVIAAWSARRAELSAASSRPGCARPGAGADALADGVRVWRGFSSNNSGDCVLVGRFEEVAAAERYAAELLDGHAPGEPFTERPYSAPLRALLEREGIAAGSEEETPDEIIRAGSAVLVHTQSAPDDAFPALRTLLWKRGGRAIYTGIHVHEPVAMVAGVTLDDPKLLETARAELGFVRRGKYLFGAVEGPFRERFEELEATAARFGGGRVAAELLALDGEIDWPRVLAARVDAAAHEWLHAVNLDLQHTDLGVTLPHRAERIAAHLGYRVQQRGGRAELFEGERLRVRAQLWGNSGLASPQTFAAELRAMLGPDVGLEARKDAVNIDTADPAAALSAAKALGEAQRIHVWMRLETIDPLPRVLARLEQDLDRRG